MGLKDNGYVMFRPNNPLIELTVIDMEEGIRECVLSPDQIDIQRICTKFGFDFDYTMGLIENKGPDVHTMVIEVQKYREHLNEVLSPEGRELTNEWRKRLRFDTRRSDD